MLFENPFFSTHPSFSSNKSRQRNLGDLVLYFKMSPPGSSRWCPTPQQVMMLEEMYRSGIRTPNATQIQQITSQLSLHGKIEAKNVFYWFQNHKARDRQKLRKKIAKQLQHQQQLYHHRQFLHYFDHSPAFRHLSYHNSASPYLFPWPQAGIHHGVEKNKSLMRMYGGDRLMMVDVGPLLSPPPPPPCYSVVSRPPLKALELFPLTASNMKEDECNNSTETSNSLSSVSCNITPPNVPLSLA